MLRREETERRQLEAEKRQFLAPYGYAPLETPLPEGWTSEQPFLSHVREGVTAVYRNTLNGETQDEPPAFGLTAQSAIELGIGGLTPVGGRGRVVPQASDVGGGMSRVSGGSDGAVAPPVGVARGDGLEAGGGQGSEDAAVAAVLDKLDHMAAVQAAAEAGTEVRPPEGVRI